MVIGKDLWFTHVGKVEASGEFLEPLSVGSAYLGSPMKVRHHHREFLLMVFFDGSFHGEDRDEDVATSSQHEINYSACWARTIQLQTVQWALRVEASPSTRSKE